QSVHSELNVLVNSTTRPRCRGQAMTAGSGERVASTPLRWAGTNDRMCCPRPSDGDSTRTYDFTGTVTSPARAESLANAASRWQPLKRRTPRPQPIPRIAGARAHHFAQREGKQPVPLVVEEPVVRLAMGGGVRPKPDDQPTAATQMRLEASHHRRRDRRHIAQ